ncbi:MAG: hypothetical protein K2Q28_09895 [Hyphomicrobium sp.]|nr:hypothetical protein [Hyphomicrobium sp.]
MLQEAFPHLVSKAPLLRGPQVWEGSRFYVDSNLSPAQRQRIVQEIVVGHLESALTNEIQSIIGVMFPAYWRNIFIRSGWNVAWLGEIHRSAEGHKKIAGDLRITPAVLEHVEKPWASITPFFPLTQTLWLSHGRHKEAAHEPHICLHCRRTVASPDHPQFPDLSGRGS